jgi:hypothetical protein
MGEELQHGGIHKDAVLRQRVISGEHKKSGGIVRLGIQADRGQHGAYGRFCERELG